VYRLLSLIKSEINVTYVENIYLLAKLTVECLTYWLPVMEILGLIVVTNKLRNVLTCYFIFEDM
jgi:hypothetical protein